jgi:hypothetical protein
MKMKNEKCVQKESLLCSLKKALKGKDISNTSPDLPHCNATLCLGREGEEKRSNN